ncbi:MAG: hypothetical protein KW802_03630 [Candidatus Doudnabacteria bacterium]|nr:hypothetical protein [Candidatus Doudnabacteria bacterium]
MLGISTIQIVSHYHTSPFEPPDEEHHPRKIAEKPALQFTVVFSNANLVDNFRGRKVAVWADCQNQIALSWYQFVASAFCLF